MDKITRPLVDQGTDLPSGLAAPARRALAGAGIRRLEQLTWMSEAEVRELHGIGPNALKQLREALTARGLAFAASNLEPASPDAWPGVGLSVRERRSKHS